MPYMHESAPLFVDLDGDNVLDYFNSLHGHRIVDEAGRLDNRMELALTVDANDGSGGQYLDPVPGRIIIEDDPEEFTADDAFFIDPHGQNIVDLDGDGILDLYITSGGFSGLQPSKPAMFDNFLLFGEKTEDGDTIFRGGRTQALMSGVNMRHGRGRVNHMLDVNGDGLLDIFTQQSRRVDNTMAPGILMINQGNRTWREDTSMMEYASTMIVTDADGDGFANEIMISRGFCFPDRDGPQEDPSYPEFGEFGGMQEFCGTRPVGTTAIYKFNPTIGAMEEISQKYYNIGDSVESQPSCCGHGLHDGVNGCSAISIATADLDRDKVTDHVFLYEDRLVFYFSSDRPSGELPIEKKYQGLVLDLPDYCDIGESVRVLDLNNASGLNILVVCRNPGTFVIYSRGTHNKDWVLQDGCNGNKSLGDVNDQSLLIPDYDELFAGVDCNDIEYKHFKKICKKWRQEGQMKPRLTTGLTLADINNDGFTDVIVSHHFGYLRFFHNTPSANSKNNKFVAFRLVGDGVNNNVYGIGATLTLSSRKSNGKYKKQFREVSFYQHTSDKKGYQDDRIHFGLGASQSLDKLTVKWPNGRVQVVFLDEWSFSSSMVPIEIRDPSSDEYFAIQSQAESSSGKSLCLSAGDMQQWTSIRPIECTSTTSFHEQFKFDSKGRLRSRRFKNYCLAPENGQLRSLAELQLVHCKFAKSSWIKSNDGTFTISGSNLGLTIAEAEEDHGAPFLYDIRQDQFQQRWKDKTVE